MKINDITCSYDDWDSLKEAIHIQTVTSNCIWRGQSNGKWKISSSLFRYFKNLNIPEFRRESLEKKAINYFKHNLNKNKNESDLYNFDNYSYYDLLVLMQHFGCPTRLVDFSKSPYVALYFAISECSSTGALYSLDLDLYQEVLKEKNLNNSLSFNIAEEWPDFTQNKCHIFFG